MCWLCTALYHGRTERRFSLLLFRIKPFGSDALCSGGVEATDLSILASGQTLLKGNLDSGLLIVFDTFFSHPPCQKGPAFPSSLVATQFPILAAKPARPQIELPAVPLKWEDSI
jgi:hypothetical protein